MTRCKLCGCFMDDNHEGDICEVCLDDMDERSELDPDYVKALEEDKTC